MSLRDTREILNLIMLRKKMARSRLFNLYRILKKKRDTKTIFSNSIDFIYEYFNFENKEKKFPSKAVKYLGRIIE